MATVQNQGNSVNEAHKSYRQSRTTFPLTYLHYTTEAYGLINPFFGMEGVEGDTIPLNSEEDLRTHTLQAPLMSKVSKNKDYYVVPMRAILPKTWEQIYANPTQGDDIPEDANCTFPIQTVMTWIEAQFKANYADVEITAAKVQLLLKFIFTAESFLSNGSLLSKFGFHLSPLFTYYTQDADGYTVFTDPRDFDQWMDDRFSTWLQSVNPVIRIGSNSYALAFEGQPLTNANISYVSKQRLCELMRDDMSFSVTSIEIPAENPPTIADLFGNAIQYQFYIPGSYAEDDGSTIAGYLNIGRLLAYQLVSFHFYTNDKIDSIYSAALYRGLMQSMAGEAYSGTTPSASDINSIRKYYSYNGELLEYDLFSESVQSALINRCGVAGQSMFAMSSTFQSRQERWMEYIRNIFGFNRSLRYGDYFTGSRPSPLAVGDVNTPVVSSEVNAVDMTKSLLMQRFLNSVNRVGRKFSNYVQMLAGTLPAPVPTDPKFLAHSANDLGSFEVENTAENQGNIVTLMRDGSSRFAFSYDVNEPCIVIGVSWYEVARIYSKTIDRHAFHRTRFDMFNKFFQYSGDQAIYRKELNAKWLVAPDQNFAYTLRYMEYKQRPSIASGGFISYLKGYAFITDNNEVGEFLQADAQISPDYIRARPSEFDRFYATLSNISLGGYFHFIVRYINQCPAEREMEYAPSVL